VIGRLTGVLATTVAVLSVAACGGSGQTSAGLESTLGYFPREPLLIAVLQTDLDGDQWREVDRIVVRRTGTHVEPFLKRFIEGATKVKWDDVRPLLGKELVIGTATRSEAGFFGDIVIAFHARDGSRLRELVGGSRLFQRIGQANGATLYRFTVAGGTFVAVEDDVFLAAESERILRLVLERRDGGDHLTADRFDAALAGVARNRLVRLYGAPSTLLGRGRLASLRGLPWIEALRTFGGAVGFNGHKAALDVVFGTDPEGLADEDLPFATGGPAPEVFDREHDIVAANRNQSLTTAFLFRVAELTEPDSRFVRHVHRLERETGIDFVEELLKQFSGPSASVVSIDGQTFAARSRVSDPARIERELRAIAGDIPDLVVGLQGLRSEGEVLLFLLAPDVLVSQAREVKVTPPSGPGRLWQVSGIEGQGPSVLWFGVIGHDFVVASDEALARRVATEPTEPVAGAAGSAVVRVDLSGLEGQVRNRLGIDLGPVGKLVGWVETSRERAHARLTLELP
jgi:hypothetical protein